MWQQIQRNIIVLCLFLAPCAFVFIVDKLLSVKKKEKSLLSNCWFKLIFRDSYFLLSLSLSFFSFFFLYSYISFVLQILLQVLEMVPSYFGIRLAALASRKELVDLENWLSSNLSTSKNIFLEVMIDGSNLSSFLFHHNPLGNL